MGLSKRSFECLISKISDDLQTEMHLTRNGIKGHKKGCWGGARSAASQTGVFLNLSSSEFLFECLQGKMNYSLGWGLPQNEDISKI